MRGAAGDGGSGGGGGGGFGLARGEAEARVGLFAAAGGFVEDGAIDFGNHNVVAEWIECPVGAEGKGVEFRLGEEAEIDGGN